MTFSLELLDSAKADMANAAAWYRQCNPYLVPDFLLCVEECLERIARHPLAYARLDGEFRRAFTHRFPYRVIYRIAGKRIIVVAVAHHSQHPSTGLSREH